MESHAHGHSLRVGRLVLTVSSALSLLAVPAGADADHEGWPHVELTTEVEGFTSPVDVVNAGDGSGRLFVAERGGVIRVLQPGASAPSTFLDLTAVTACDGLFSVVFPPGYAASGRFYVVHQVAGCDLALARYRVSADPDVADPASREAVLTVPTAPPGSNFHVGSKLVFGPDGFLYLSIGEGQYRDTPDDTAQDLSTLLGKVLRIDVEGPATYEVPASNPFVGVAGARPEIWALGLRNPWRMSFDARTGDLFIGDVGQASAEEINQQPGSSSGGENYGWPVMEGGSCYGGASCDPDGLTLPVSEYGRDEGCSVSAGVTPRGPREPGLDGIFLFGDFCTGRIWGLRGSQRELLLDTPLMITGFGLDEAGGVWAADFAGGAIHRLTQDCGDQACDFDGDLVPDDADGCPSTPGSLEGCPDADGDGVGDATDPCPAVAGPASGCPAEAAAAAGPILVDRADDPDGDGLVHLVLGPGNDVVCVDPGAGLRVVIDAGAGDDVILTAARGPCAVFPPTVGSPTVVRLDGREGNDLLLAAEGDDRLRGGAGADRLRGAGGRDVLGGGSGPDRVSGGRGADVCRTGPGDDRQSSCERP